MKSKCLKGLLNIFYHHYKVWRKLILFKLQENKRNNTSSKYMTYCLSCKKHTNNMASRSVTMTNEVLRQKPKFSVSLSDKSIFLNKKPSKRSD